MLRDIGIFRLNEFPMWSKSSGGKCGRRLRMDIIMYITSIVFTLIAWGAGLLLDANIHFGDPQGFLGLRVLLPVLAMGLCLLRAMKEDKRNGDK